MELIQLGLNKEAVATTKMTIGMNFSGPGGGSWTIDVNEGNVAVEEKQASNPDFEMTQRPETFEAMSVKAINPLWAMVTGKIKVKGVRNIGGFFKLLSPPPLTEIMEPV
jgi:putative sterol carrier protein